MIHIAVNVIAKPVSDPSRRNFIKQATTLTIIGGSAFILEACGGGEFSYKL